MAEPTFYLFDGYNLLHAGRFRNAAELVDRLADFVSLRGAGGVVVFDGHGRDTTIGALEVRFATHADSLLERLAAERRGRERVCIVSSDRAIRGAAAAEISVVGSTGFVRDLETASRREATRMPLADRLDDDVRARLERLRRGEA